MEKLDSGSVLVMCLLCKCGCVLRIGPSRCVDWEECFPDVGTGKGACSMCGLGRGPSVGTGKRAFAVCRLGMMARGSDREAGQDECASVHACYGPARFKCTSCKWACCGLWPS